MPWTRRRKIAVLGVAGACGVVAILLLLTVVGGWAPLAHWTCKDESVANRATVQIPTLLVNSPFGGRGSGNVTFPAGFLPNGLSGMGTGYLNGGAAWGGYLSSLAVYSVRTTLAMGPGANDRCGQPYRVVLAPTGDISTGIPILGPGNVSDAVEPSVLFPRANTIYNNLTFDNGFYGSNAPNITTCGTPAKSIPVLASYVTLGYRFGEGGQNRTASFAPPVLEIQFQYWFPANFGTWQVDDLSAPGGPGGGWAFNFLGACT